jgi:hypothetical protein
MKTFSLNKIIAIFALLFFIGGGKTLARNGQPKTLPIINYSPNGSKFYSDFTIDWTTQKLQIIVDVTNCTTDASGNNPDDIFDLCPQTTSDVGWESPTPVVHVYCDGTQLKLRGNKFTGKSNLKPDITLGSSYDKTNITIEIDNENGLTVNGNSTTLTATFLTELLNNSNLTFASQEGSGRMHGTYKSVKVVSKNKAVITNKSWDEGSIVNSLYTNYQGNGTKFEKETAIDWTNQKVVAEIDISTCGTGTEDLFSIGNEVTVFDGGNNIHMYKTSGGFSAYLAGNPASGDGTAVTSGIVPDRNILRVELSSENGFVVNGTVVFSKEKINKYSTIFSLSTIKVGSGEGTNQESRAKYNYISVATKDYQTATEKSSNVLNEVTINEFVAQSNVDVQLKRSLSPAHWNSFCVPFTISADVIAEKFGAGTLVYTFGSMNGNVMNFKASTTIDAGKPYIVKPTKEVVDPTFIGVNIEASDPVKSGENGFFMQGTYGAKTDLTTDGTNLFLGEGNKFYKPSGTTTAKMKGLRAFFIVPQGTNFAALRANIDGATTAIDELTTVVEQPTDNRIYNLQGQFVGTSFEGLHGVYVQNGKKVLVK